MRATMPAMVRYLVPPMRTREWVFGVRRRGLAEMFSRPELGEGVAYCESIHYYKGPGGRYDLTRVLLVAKRHEGNSVGCAVKFVGAKIPPTGPLTPDCFEVFDPSPIDWVKAKMILPDVDMLKLYAKEERERAWTEPW
jgi:hypothetical protein